MISNELFNFYYECDYNKIPSHFYEWNQKKQFRYKLND